MKNPIPKVFLLLLGRKQWENLLISRRRSQNIIWMDGHWKLLLIMIIYKEKWVFLILAMGNKIGHTKRVIKVKQTTDVNRIYWLWHDSLDEKDKLCQAKVNGTTKMWRKKEKEKDVAKILTGRNLDDFFMTAKVLPRQPDRWDETNNHVIKKKRYKPTYVDTQVTLKISFIIVFTTNKNIIQISKNQACISL